MMNKKGFTLIELLAVLVILAIIGLITTPVVLSAIGTARSNANKESARAFVKAAEFFCASKLMETPSVTVNEIVMTGAVAPQFNMADVNAKGTKPTAFGTTTARFLLDTSCVVAPAATLTVGGTVYTVSTFATS